MQSSMWLMLLFVFLAGGIGGVINALMTDNGFLLPKREDVDGKASIFRPGYLGNVLIGSTGAVVSWGLYGPLSSYLIAGTAEALRANVSPEKVGLSLASLVGAVLIGVAGSRWLTSEVDKNLLKAAAAEAAGSKSSTTASQQIAMASPAQALNIARNMSK